MLELHNPLQDLGGFLLTPRTNHAHRVDTRPVVEMLPDRKQLSGRADCAEVVSVHKQVWDPLLAPQHHGCDLDIVEVELTGILPHQESFQCRSRPFSRDEGATHALEAETLSGLHVDRLWAWWRGKRPPSSPRHRRTCRVGLQAFQTPLPLLTSKRATDKGGVSRMTSSRW